MKKLDFDIPVLYDHKYVIGYVTKIFIDKIGVKVEFILYKKYKAKHLSFGFKVILYKNINSYRYIYKYNILEISITNNPRNLNTYFYPI